MGRSSRVDRGPKPDDLAVEDRDSRSSPGDQVRHVWPDDVGDHHGTVVAMGGEDRADRREVVAGGRTDQRRPGWPWRRRRRRHAVGRAGRPNAAIASSSRSWGSAWAVIPSRPVIVTAPTRALTIASSVASMVASNNAPITKSLRARISTVTRGSARYDVCGSE